MSARQSRATFTGKALSIIRVLYCVFRPPFPQAFCLALTPTAVSRDDCCRKFTTIIGTRPKNVAPMPKHRPYSRSAGQPHYQVINGPFSGLQILRQALATAVVYNFFSEPLISLMRQALTSRYIPWTKALPVYVTEGC